MAYTLTPGFTATQSIPVLADTLSIPYNLPRQNLSLIGLPSFIGTNQLLLYPHLRKDRTRRIRVLAGKEWHYNHLGCQNKNEMFFLVRGLAGAAPLATIFRPFRAGSAGQFSF